MYNSSLFVWTCCNIIIHDHNKINGAIVVWLYNINRRRYSLYFLGLVDRCRRPAVSYYHQLPHNYYLHNFISLRQVHLDDAGDRCGTRSDFNRTVVRFSNVWNLRRSDTTRKRILDRSFGENNSLCRRCLDIASRIGIYLILLYFVQTICCIMCRLSESWMISNLFYSYFQKLMFLTKNTFE